MIQESPENLENEIILNLLAPIADRPRLDSLLVRDIDWDHVFQTVEEHSIVPIIYKSIEQNISGLIPSAAVDKFRTRYKAIAAFNFARSTQLIKLADHLEGNGVPVIAYKGMALAEYAYGDTTMRQFGDIDLFIRKENFPRAKALLEEIGCKPAWTLNDRQEKAVLKYYYEYPLLYGETNTLVELHWEWVESFFTFDFEIEGIWDRTVPVNLYGRQIKTLCAEDYMVVLCSHGSKHFWKRISWICDVAKLIENRKIDWDAVIRRSSRYGALRMVWLGVYLAKQLCKIDLPENIRALIIADRNVIRLGDRFTGTLFEDEREPSRWTEMARVHLNMREKFGTKLKYSYRLLTTKAIDSMFSPMGRPR